jgi:hypothetical protein
MTSSKSGVPCPAPSISLDPWTDALSLQSFDYRVYADPETKTSMPTLLTQFALDGSVVTHATESDTRQSKEAQSPKIRESSENWQSKTSKDSYDVEDSQQRKETPVSQVREGQKRPPGMTAKQWKRKLKNREAAQASRRRQAREFQDVVAYHNELTEKYLSLSKLYEERQKQCQKCSRSSPLY